MKYVYLLVLSGLACAFPFVMGDPSLTSLAVNTLLFCTAALAWNIFSGYTGYISLGHATYYGLGAYSMAIACTDWNVQGGFLPFLLVPVAGLVAVFFALPLGWIALRTKRHIFLVLTIAIFTIFQALAFNLEGITGGSGGMFLPNPPWDASFFDVPFYFVSLALCLLTLLAAWWVRTSPYGLRLLAIRDDEDRAWGLGVHTGNYKLGAYALSAFFIAMVGALFVYFEGSITPDAGFSPGFDVAIALMAFLGGRDTIAGPLWGGLLLVPLQQLLSLQYGSTPLVTILYGGLLLAVLLLLPEGLVPSMSGQWHAWKKALHKPGQRESLQSQRIALSEMSLGLAQTVAAPGKERQDSFPLPGPRDTARPFPHIPSRAQVLPPSTVAPSIRRVKSQRLVSLSPGTLLGVTPEKGGNAPVISWRCPICGKPFHLKDTLCYCPRCGTTQLLPDGSAKK